MLCFKGLLGMFERLWQAKCDIIVEVIYFQNRII